MGCEEAASKVGGRTSEARNVGGRTGLVEGMQEEMCGRVGGGRER